MGKEEVAGEEPETAPYSRGALGPPHREPVIMHHSFLGPERSEGLYDLTHSAPRVWGLVAS